MQHSGFSSLPLGAVSTWLVGSESRVRRRARQAKQRDTWQLRGSGTELRCFVGELECPGPCRMGRVLGAGEGQRGLCGSEQEGRLGEVGVGREARLAPGKPGLLGGAPVLLHPAGANRGRSRGHSCLVLGSLYMALEWS